MKIADLIFSGLSVLFSIYLMIKSAELPIGWIQGAGPGGGAFPFWLSLILLICSIAIFVRNLLKVSPEGRSAAIFMDDHAKQLFVVVMVSLGLMIGLIHVIGVYFAVPLFMAFYMRFLGRHRWSLVAAVSIATPIITFVFFEKLLLILLPKGYTEPLFYIFY